MRRALFTLLFISAAVQAAAAPGAPPEPPPAAAASITARAQVIAAGPSLDARAAGRLLLSHVENGEVTTAGGLAQMAWRGSEPDSGPTLLIEFVAN